MTQPPFIKSLVLGIFLALSLEFPCQVLAQDPPPTVIVAAASPTSPAKTGSVPAKPLEKMKAEVLQQRPWMNDLYSWNESFDLDQKDVKASQTGAYCIGNGRSFALIGLSAPLWSWSNIYGASYQEPDLGALRMSVTKAGVEGFMPKQQIGWVRRSGVVKVRAEGKGIVVESYDFAPVTPTDDNAWDNPPVLVRMVHIINDGDHTQSDIDIELKIQSAWNVHLKDKIEGKDLVMTQKASRAKKKTVWRLASFDPRNVRIWDDNLHYAVPNLGPGEETWAAFFLLSSDSAHDNAALAADLRKTGALTLLDQTRDYYQNWFAQGTEFSGDPKVVDLFEIESMIFKCQQSRTGGFSPLIGYSYTWIRDNNGPIRWLLKTGHPQEAKRAMDFFYGVASSMGSLPNSIRVDYTLNYHLKDLSNIHVEHAETPNWIVLQHWWYYETTGDLEFIRGRWNYLKRCVEGQVNVGDQYFFHRDETYLWCLESRIFDQIQYPNYYLSTYAYATDSSFDVVSAADHLAYLGKYLEMDKDVAHLKKLADAVRDKAESTYWNEKDGYWAPAESLLGPLYNAPFANILLNPFWCGYARNDLDPLGETPLSSKRAVEALRNAYPWLGREDGFWKTTPSVDFFVGMNPGQLLYALCKARSPWAAKVYPDVFKAATPSGEFAEMYDGNYKPWNPPTWGIGTSGRVRPWEGGLDTESILEYLTGFSPDAGDNRAVFAPHMPEDQKEFTADRLLVANSRLSLDMKRTSSKQWTLNFHLDKGNPLEVVLDLWADRRSLDNVDGPMTISWDKTVSETGGVEALCRFTLEEGADVAVTVSEGATLPAEIGDPPKPQLFQPEPYVTADADLLLMTSPTGIFNKYKHTPPEDFPAVAQTELKAVRKATSSVSFLDMDLPISADDIAHALLDEKAKPKVKVAVFGRGAFCSGKHHFKPVSFWIDPKLFRAVKRFVEEGGCLLIGPSYSDREVLPNWFLTWTGGGWEEGTVPDHAVPVDSAKIASGQERIDEMNVGDPQSEADHGATFVGVTFTDTQNLPDSLDEKKLIQEQGRGFTGYGEFTMKTEPGFRHRVWIRVDTGRNIQGMALQVRDGNKWVQLGVRTQNGGTTRRFLALYFDVPEKLVTGPQTLFRLVSKSGAEVNVYHLWIYKIEKGKGRSLSQLLGLAGGLESFYVPHGLVPQGKNWKTPLVLSQHPEQGAVLIQKIGQGYVLRSELAVEDSVPLLKALLNGQNLEQLGEVW